nr:zinc finger MYM-type protein 1-like [Coffea arabica]
MERFFKPKRVRSGESSNEPNISEPVQNQSCVELNLNDIVSDPGLRKSVEKFDISLRDHVRREYLTRGPCQPIGHMYPKTSFGKQHRSFQDSWYQKFVWLEYSISKDAAFCFWCFLFKTQNKGGRYAEDAFTKTGFNNWKKAMERFNEHIGAVNSCHNDARIQFESFQDQRHSVSNVLRSCGREIDIAYRTRLTAALDVTRFLLKQGLAFRGNDESTSSSNRGNFLELFEWYSQRNTEIFEVVNQNAPANNQLTSPMIQKDLAHACASEITSVIINDIGDNYFSLIVDESRDSSVKEQMGVVLRYVNKEGRVIERFLAIVHVSDTTSLCLKDAIDSLFAQHGLSLSKLRGQGYDGASNMRGEFNGLKALILQENPYAMYIHCFAHQLQLVIVAVAKGNIIVSEFFVYVSMIVNLTGASCKRRDQLRQIEHDKIVTLLDSGDIISGKGKNQETSLARPGDTRWGSHYLTLLRLSSMWASVIGILGNIQDDATTSDNRGMARGLIDRMNDYEFVFALHLMKYLLGITNDLSLVLQQRDQNIVQAMSLIDTMKSQLQDFREEGWQIILDEVNNFCELNMIPVIDMEDSIAIRGNARRSRRGQTITNFHHYRVKIFCEVVDLIIQEMNNRFSEKLLRLADLYPEDFSSNDYLYLESQLRNYIYNVQRDPQFSEVGDLGSLAQQMVKTGKNTVFPLVYRLIQLALVLPVATASVERVFSAMSIVKTDLRNKMGDEWMNDCLVIYIEKDIFATIENEQILQRFQRMKTRRMQLPPLRYSSATTTNTSSVNQ